VFEIGYSLRAARERQGIGLPEAELATKIRAKYIRALEEEDFAALPADTYARGFLRTYAEYLGLDGEIYVDEYASRFHNAEWEDEPAVSRRRRPRRTQRERTIERRGVLLALAGIAVLVALVVGAWVWGNPPSAAKGIIIRGIGRGTVVVVRQNSRTGHVLFNHLLAHGHEQSFDGTRFFIYAHRPAGVSITHSTGVAIVGG
jgi:hypothetical protein